MPPKPSQSKPPAPASAASAKLKKEKSVSSSGATTADFLKTEDVLQAVLLADSFQVKFRPLTQQKPKVLLPLLNIPLLEYSLEFLVSGGVGELFVFCCSHAAQIQAYIDSVEFGTKWKRRKGLVIKTIVSESCFSFGDAMRYLDSLDIIKRDFVLISGDVITNLRLEPIVKQHKARVQQDKRNMMTLIFKQASPTHRTRPLNDDAVLVIDPSTQQLLVYENDRSNPRISLETQLLSETKSSLQLRYDLMDSHISICTPEVLMLFTDNFDWQTFHGDFLTGVLGSEILGNKLFVHTISRDEYAARCEDLRSYDSISKDVIHRWTYPLVPDNNLLGGFSTTYKYYRGNIYKEENITISRESKIGEETTIGAGTTIGAKTQIKQSVIGRDCQIGNKVNINGSYIWGNVIIEDGAVIDRAILADGVIVRAGARISQGAILSFNTIIGAHHTVPPYTKITTIRSDDEDQDATDDLDSNLTEDADGLTPKHVAASAPAPSPTSGAPIRKNNNSQPDWNPAEVGPSGVGRVYTGKDVEEDEELDDENEDGTTRTNFPYKQSELNSIAPNPLAVKAWLCSQFQDESEDEWDEIDGETEDAGADEDEHDDPTLANQLGARGSTLNSNFHKFVQEACETLKRGHTEKLSLDDISLEMNALKFSHNTTVEEFAHATFLALFNLLNEKVNPKGATFTALDPTKNKVVMNNLGALLKSWHPLLLKFGKLVSDQVHMLQGLEQACLLSGYIAAANSTAVAASSVTPTSAASTSTLAAPSIYTPLFTTTLHIMYNYEVFSEEAFDQWYEDLKAGEEGEDHLLLKQVQPFKTWLDEAEEDEEDEEEEDD